MRLVDWPRASFSSQTRKDALPSFFMLITVGSPCNEIPSPTNSGTRDCPSTSGRFVLGPNCWLPHHEGANMSMAKTFWFGVLVAFGAVTAASTDGLAQQRSGVRIEGQVQAGGGPLANSTVTLWAASAGEPSQLAQARTNNDGRFELGSQETLGADVILYVVAKGGEAAVNRGAGDNPAAALLAVLGNMPPPKVVINEMSTVASVWMHNQFIDGAAIKGHALGLKIAAGNV